MKKEQQKSTEISGYRPMEISDYVVLFGIIIGIVFSFIMAFFHPYITNIF
jgi:acid phosphatase family membrane protein YuiD